MNRLLLLTIVALYWGQVNADSFRCGRKVVKLGESSNALIEKCGDPVRRGGNGRGGLIGMLIIAAFGKFNCEKCGKIPTKEFPDEVRGKMRMNSMIMVIGAIILGIGLVALLVAMQ